MIVIDWLIEFFGYRLPRAAEARQFRALIEQGVVTVGPGTYGIPRVLTFRGCASRLIIGPYVSITTGATVLLGGNHPTSWASLYPFRARFDLDGAYADGMPYSKGDVIVGADAWIGHDALIMSGVSIGTGAIIAARSVVTQSVPEYAVVAGNPARIVKYRFDEETRARLVATRWWELPRGRLELLIPLLSSPDVGLLLSELERERGAL